MRDWMNIITEGMLSESTGQECEFIHDQATGWYLVLEDRFDAEQEERWGNWRDNADVVGPFASLEVAEQYLRAHYPNPGGHYAREADADDAKLIAGAEKPREDRQRW